MDVKTGWNQKHPRLFFNQDWVTRFRHQISSIETIKKEWEKMLLQAEKLLEEQLVDESIADGPDTQHGNYGRPGNQISSMGMTLGLAYQVTGETKYAEKLRDALLFYGHYQKWYGKGLRRNDPPWHSELNTARFCYGFAVGFDCVYDFLTESERIFIRDAVVKLGILPTLSDWVFPETRIHAIDTMGHNWWSVCVAQAGLAVLSILGEEKKAEQWLAEVLSAFPEFFNFKGSVLGNKSPNFDEKGAFYESVNYTNYGLGEYLLFRLAFNTITGNFNNLDQPLLEKAGDFFIQSLYPTENSFLTVNFGDGHIHSGAVEAVKMLLANRFEQPQLRWYLQRVQPEFNAFDLIYYDEIWKGEIKTPGTEKTTEIYEEIGWALMRSSWEKDATLLAVKSGFTWNHAHADAGSFLLFHQGQPVLIDSGNCSYARPEYHEYYCQSKAHNVVLFNGQGQNREDIARGVKEPGQLYHLIDHEGLRYVYADNTGPLSRYFSRNFRHFLWLDDVILIFDDLRAHEVGTLQWLLHYEGEANQDTNGDYRIRNENSEVVIRGVFPKDIKATEEQGLADHDPDRKVAYYSFSTSSPTNEAKFLTAIFPVRSETEYSFPEVVPLEGENWIGVRVIHQGHQTDVYMNLRADGRVMHRNSITTLNGWETDAYLIAVTRPLGSDEKNVDTVERCFISYGSYIRRNKQVLFSSLTKVTAAFSTDKSEFKISLQGQSSIRAEFYLPTPPARVSLNGQQAEGKYSRQTSRVTVSCITPKAVSRRPG